MLGLLTMMVLIVVAVGVTLTPILVDLLVPGFSGPRRDLAIALVRILFPGVGLLALSAWCLGVLNTHRLFFLSYAAPVVWNVAIVVATIAAARGRGPDAIVIWIAWGAAAGSALQFLIQLPAVRRVAGPVRPSLDRRSAAVQTVVKNVGPAFLARGAVQISAFLDAWIASWLPLGSVAALSNSQLLYTLPISLFGMSVAASELPAMAVDSVQGPQTGALIERLRTGGARVAFFVVPSVLIFLLLGHQVAGLVFQSGAFTRDDAYWVWGTLAGATVGLLPQAWGRLLNSAHYALGDTRTPLRYALTRVTLSVALGATLAFQGPKLLGLDAKWGTVGLALGTAVAGTLEWFLLRRSMTGRLGAFGLPRSRHAKLWVAAVLAGGAAWIVLTLATGSPVLVTASLSLAAFGLVYLAAAWFLRVPELAVISVRLAR